MAAEQAGCFGPKSSTFLAANPDAVRDVRVARAVGLPVERFARLSEAEQQLQIAYDAAEQAKCPDCGGDPAECGDAEKLWYPQRHICYATREREAANWRYDQLHEDRPFHDGTFKNWHKDRSKMFPYHARDGVTVYVAGFDLDPDGTWLEPERLSAQATEPEESPAVE